MKRVKRVNHNNIKKIVKEHFFNDEFMLPESRIDNIIKEYLSERDEFLEDEEALHDKTNFKPKTLEALIDMIDGLSEMVGDLEVIGEKEGNVLVYTDVYADEVISNITDNMYVILEDLNDLEELSDNDELDEQ